MLSDQQIFQHGHARKQANILKRAGDPRVLRDDKVRHAFEQVQFAPGADEAALAAVGEFFEPVPGRDIAMRDLLRTPEAVPDRSGGSAATATPLTGAVLSPSPTPITSSAISINRKLVPSLMNASDNAPAPMKVLP